MATSSQRNRAELDFLTAIYRRSVRRQNRIESLELRQLPSLTTIAPGTAVANAAANPAKLQGVNLVYWDDQQNTPQTQAAATSAGLNEYRFPGGSASDEYHFNIAANFGDSAANTVPQFAQFIQTVGGTGIVTVDYGSGSPQEAEAELAYLLGSPADTIAIGSGPELVDTVDGGSGAWQSVNWQSIGYWAGLRAAAPLAHDDGLNFLRLGQPAPFTGITSFEIGNEEYGSWETDNHGTGIAGGCRTTRQPMHCSPASSHRLPSRRRRRVNCRPSPSASTVVTPPGTTTATGPATSSPTDWPTGSSPVSFQTTATCRSPATKATRSC